MTGMHDAEREALHTLLDEVIAARERIPTDGFARDSLLASASLLFKKLVDQHGVGIHHADDSLSRDPDDRLARLASICVWAGKTLPDFNSKGHITRPEAWQFASELSDLRLTATLPDWLRPRGRQQQTPDVTRCRALAVTWAIAIRPFFTKKADADAEVAVAFGVSSKRLNDWRREQIEREPAFASQLSAASCGHDGPGAPCALIADDDKNLLVTKYDYRPHLIRHGEQYKKLSA
jgi:hypothetical protein